jgi:hypothetical protein
MRKTFVVGRLTGSSSHILLLDSDAAGSRLRLDPPLDPETSTSSLQTRLPLPDPLTVH